MSTSRVFKHTLLWDINTLSCHWHRIRHRSVTGSWTGAYILKVAYLTAVQYINREKGSPTFAFISFLPQSYPSVSLSVLTLLSSVFSCIFLSPLLFHVYFTTTGLKEPSQWIDAMRRKPEDNCAKGRLRLMSSSSHTLFISSAVRISPRHNLFTHCKSSPSLLGRIDFDCDWEGLRIPAINEWKCRD